MVHRRIVLEYLLRGAGIVALNSCTPASKKPILQRLGESQQEKRIDWTKLPNEEELRRILPQAFQTVTGEDIGDYVDSISIKSLQRVRRESGKNAMAYFRPHTREMVIGLPSLYSEYSKILRSGDPIPPVREVEESLALKLWDVVFHKSGHALKIFSSSEIKPLYGQMGCNTTPERLLLSSILGETHFLTPKQRANTRKKINVDISISEAYAIFSSLTSQAILTEDIPEQREALLRSNMIGHFPSHGLTEERARFLHILPVVDKGFSQYYITGEFLGLVLSSKFDYDLVKTTQYMTNNPIETIVRDTIDILGIDPSSFTEHPIVDFSVETFKFKPKEGYPTDPTERVYAELDRSVKGIAARYGISSIQGVSDLLPQGSSTENFKRALPILLEPGIQELCFYYDNRLDLGPIAREDSDLYSDDTFQEYLRLRLNQSRRTRDLRNSNGGLDDLMENLRTENREIEGFMEQHKEYRLLDRILRDCIDNLTVAIEISEDPLMKTEYPTQSEEFSKKASQLLMDFYEQKVPQGTDLNYLLLGAYLLIHKTSDVDSAENMLGYIMAKREEHYIETEWSNFYFTEMEKGEIPIEELSAAFQVYMDQDEGYQKAMVHNLRFDNTFLECALGYAQLLNKTGKSEEALETLSLFEQDLIQTKFEPELITKDTLLTSLVRNPKKEHLEKLRIVKAYTLEQLGKEDEALAIYQLLMPDLSPEKDMGGLYASPLVEQFRINHPTRSGHQLSLKAGSVKRDDPTTAFDNMFAQEYVNWRITELQNKNH